MRRSHALSVVLLAFASLVSACRDHEGTGPRPAISIIPITRTSLTGVAGQDLTEEILARVVDERGRPVVGQAVSFVVTVGDGWVLHNSWVSDDSGLVRERWRLGGLAGVPQVMEARAIERNTLNLLATATFTATARPAALASLRVVGDTVRVLAHGDSTLVEVEGLDRFGNVVPRSTFQPVLFAPDAMAAVSGSYARAQGWGDATVEAHAGAAVARLRLAIPATQLTLYTIDGSFLSHVVRAHGAIRTFGIQTTSSGSQRGVAYRLEGNALVQEHDFSGFGAPRDSWSAGPDAAAWVATDGALFTSTASGVWSQVTGFPNGSPRSVTGLPGGTTMYVSTATTTDVRPFVYARTNDSWQDLGFPQLRGDSAYQIVRLSAFPGGVLATGGLELPRFAGRSMASIVRWNGTTWTWLDLAPLPTGTLSSSITSPSFTRDGRIAFAVRTILSTSGTRTWELLEINDAMVTTTPLVSAIGAPSTVIVTPEGRPIVVTAFGWQERGANGAWVLHRLPTPWLTSSEEPWLDEDGALWLTLAHPVRQPANAPLPTTSALLRYRR